MSLTDRPAAGSDRAADAEVHWVMHLRFDASGTRPDDIGELVRKAGGWLQGASPLASNETQPTWRYKLAANTIHGSQLIVAMIWKLPGVDVLRTTDATFGTHLGGKIEIRNKTSVETQSDLTAAYTPGFAHVASVIADDAEQVWRLSMKHNTVAIVTDGSAVSGLGNLGPHAALPVMEGKALVFKAFADIDAFPICLASQDVDEIVRTVTLMEAGFGAIMLEDIAGPRCFEIEERLRETLHIPVFHDDQHATAVAATAALINAAKLVKKTPSELKVVIVGAGAAGASAARLFTQIGIENIIVCDRGGALHRGRDGLNKYKRWLAERTNPMQLSGPARSVLVGADVLLGLSGPGFVTVRDIERMAPDPIVFALANPDPGLYPDEVESRVAVFATGRSDYPNQVDSGLCYPGIFRGALDCRARAINEDMKLAAARAIAGMVAPGQLSKRHILPRIFDGVAHEVAREVSQAARRAGLAAVHSSMYSLNANEAHDDGGPTQ
ncbi:MAG: NAD-dependent malic enzyme [Proteobacteria bacterium]|nr:NAD-dependent malic enzyme [Pseudomonadota bacterium]